MNDGIEYQAWGAVETVTGSAHLIDTGTSRVLIDCGMFQGHRSEAYERNWTFPYDPASLDAVILSHAHVDHCGNLPNLTRKGYRGTIHCASATADLATLMLRDTAYLQERDAAFVSKRRHRKGADPVDPLYTIEDAEECATHLLSHPYNERVQLTPDVAVTFRDAGHILGSATPRLEFGAHGERGVFGYILDLGRYDRPILHDPDPPTDVDWFVMESTYGNRLHDAQTHTDKEFADALYRVQARGGRAIIPCFALERTQEILYALTALIHKGLAPRLPIYLDSPLAINLTEVFRKWSSCFDADTRARIEAGDDPFGTADIRYLRTVDESKSLNEKHEPMIVISASGMCEAGRVVHHLANGVGDPRNAVIIVGFMAENTVGRRLVEGRPSIRLFGEEFPVHAEIVSLRAFSAHADRNDLLRYVDSVKAHAQSAILVHGEDEGRTALASAIRERHLDVHTPVRGDVFKLVKGQPARLVRNIRPVVDDPFATETRKPVRRERTGSEYAE